MRPIRLHARSAFVRLVALALLGPSSSWAEPPLTPDEVWAKLQIGNRRFVQGRPMRRELVDERSQLAAGDHPWVIVLGCSDSGVSPELVFDQSLGDMFVVRTAGNVADPLALGSIEYALAHLQPTALVILGHEKCGAVAAAASGNKMPTANLDAVVRKIRPALKDLEDVVTGEALIQRGVEENVRHCAAELVEESPIVRKHVEEHHLAIVRAVYDLDTGEVTRLD
jgi:carbonic anhydrase